MEAPLLEIRQTPSTGRGLFAAHPISGGEAVLTFQGWLARTDELCDQWLALQVGPDQWLCSHGDLLDDCANHSCEPNTGFLDGTPTLHALRDIAAGEEIVWDYSTSISFPGWTLDCRCRATNCRGTVRSWQDLAEADRGRLHAIALAYLRQPR